MGAHRRRSNMISGGGASIRRTDLLSLSNLRNDGRKPHEIRRLRIQIGPLQQVGESSNSCTGSALVEMGLTKAFATVTGPTSCLRRTDERSDRAIVEVTVQAAPFSTADRRNFNPNSDRRLLEISHALQRALEAAILLETYPRSRIQVDVTILADDGGRLCAAVNAASLAVIDAGIPVKDFVCACSAGYSSTIGTSSTTPLVDLNRREEAGGSSGGSVHLPCAILPQRGTMVLAQCEARVPDWNTLERVLEAATDGCRAVFELMQAAVQEKAAAALAARSGRANIAVAGNS